RFNGSRTFGKLRTSYNLNYVKFHKDMAPDGPWLSAYTSPANIDFDQMKDWEDPSSIANPANYFTDQVKNPFFLLDNYRQETDQNILNGKIELDYRITPWFSAMYRLGMYTSSEESRNKTGKFEAEGRRNVVGSVTDGSADFQRFNGDFILNFDKRFGKFTTRLLLGQNFRSDYTKTISIGAENLLLPGLYNPGSRVGELSSRSGSGITEYRSLAAYGELTAGYNDYLFLTLTGRNDWVSVLSQDNRS